MKSIILGPVRPWASPYTPPLLAAESIEVTSNSGEQYYQVAKDTKSFLEGHGVIVCATVGDNASAVQNALNRCLVFLWFACCSRFLCSGSNPKTKHAQQSDVLHTVSSCYSKIWKVPHSYGGLWPTMPPPLVCTGLGGVLGQSAH